MGHPPTQPELARLADAGPVGIMVASATGVIAYANRTLALLLGYTGGDELLGRNVIDLLAPEDLDARPIDPTRVKLGAPAHNERLMLRKDGSHVWTKTITDLGPDGRYLFWLWDLSAHQRLETELREAQKLEAVGLLAAGVAHDLNNLLAVVQGHAELLRAQQLAANGERSLGYIAEAAGRAAELTQKLLAFGRRQVLQPQHVLLGTLLAKNASLLTSLVGDDIALQLDVAPDLDWVDVDPAHVEQAVWNLVTNARQAMPHGGTIKIQVENVLLSADELAALPRARPDARFVAIRVVDTGSGMDAETLRRIFDPFFTTKALGTGLGLSVVHGVVGQSGGVVRVSSKVGEGSRFELCFPRVERTPEQPAVRAHAALAIAASGARSQVLVVEDDPQIRAWLIQALSRRGFAVESACDAEVALEQLEHATAAPDILVTDVHMPGASGTELVTKLRARWPRLPVVFMTGYAEVEALRAMPSDAQLLRKPFTTEQAVEALRRAVESMVEGAGPV